MSRGRALALAAVLLAAFATLPPALPALGATSSTRCVFGGAVPGYRALQIHLPSGSDFLSLQLHGDRSPRPLADETGWHLAEGLVVLDAATQQIVAYQILNAGTAPPVVVASAEGGPDVRQGIVAPEGPWIHSSRKMAVDLPPGTYIVVAFGVGGPSSGALAQHWGASIYLQGTHACAAAVPGATFDYNHTDFDGGTQVYAPGVGVGEDLTLAVDLQRTLVVGMIDAGFQGMDTGEVNVDYDLAGRTGTVGREVVPFVSSAGPHSFRASYRGVYPIISIAGVAVDLGS